MNPDKKSPVLAEITNQLQEWWHFARVLMAVGLLSIPSSLAKQPLSTSHQKTKPAAAQTNPEYPQLDLVDPHQLFNRALADNSVVIIGSYGTPTAGGVDTGWGSINSGHRAPNNDPYQNYNDINSYFEQHLTKVVIGHHFDGVLLYGRTASGSINIVGDTIDFAKFVVNHGGTVSLNLRPPADFTVPELEELVRQVWTGQLEYASGEKVVSQQFIAQSGAVLSLDLEEMLRNYPGGIPATELNKVLNTYREIMIGYGYSNPVILFYERDAVPDMVNDASQLNSNSMVIIYSGFVPSGSLDVKNNYTHSNIRSYGHNRGGCMVYDNWYLAQQQKDGLTDEQFFQYINQDICLLVMPQ